MEFIPLETHSARGKRKAPAKEVHQGKKAVKNEVVIPKKVKGKPQPKIIEKKRVKNKYRQNLEEKKKQKVKKKVKVKKEEEEEEEEEIDNAIEKVIKEEEGQDEEEEDEDEEEEEEEDNEDVNEENAEDEEDKKEQAWKRKCQQMNEKKKNRLFVKLKKKIHSEAQIRELHPDIKAVIFPRKKNTRWCWAVFPSEERAHEAWKTLAKKQDVFVSKPNPYEKVQLKREKKMKAVKKRKEAAEKLKQLWT